MFEDRGSVGGSRGALGAALTTRRAVPWQLLIVAALLAIALLLQVSWELSGKQPSLAPATHRAIPRASLSALPLSAQAQISAAIGADSPTYRIVSGAAGLRAANPAQRLRESFSGDGVTVSSGSTQLTLRLDSFGHGISVNPVGVVSPNASGNRVTYRRSGLTEWYANSPLGLEQGFTIARPLAPPATGLLTVSLAVSGNARAVVAHDGRSLTASDGDRSVLRYAGLAAMDARGRPLSSWLERSRGHILIRVDAAGARYPVRIDPFIQKGGVYAPLGGRFLPYPENGVGQFGESVALSSDGSTEVVGAPYGNPFGNKIGAVYIFTRSGQQVKITGGGEIGGARFGESVAVSADGTTVLVGAPGDNSNVGAAWVFTRSGSTWTQQQKILGGGTVGESYFGQSVALSSNGNIALVGGVNDNSGLGAAWAFTRSGTTWTPQGSKFSGSGEIGGSGFGSSVALSAAGGTAVIGGPRDNGEIGAVWVFTSSGSAWTQQAKLTGTGEVGKGQFGFRVAVSSAGDAAVVGGPFDNSNAGAVWAFTRTGATWSQQGSKLTATGEVGGAAFGAGVAVASDGNTALIGGPWDSSKAGAAWVFTRAGATWTQQQKLTGSGPISTFGSEVALSSDGSTALIGSPFEEGQVGGAWVFTLQAKLTGEGENGEGNFGYALAISSDGTTALVGGPSDNPALGEGGVGAAWVFVRSASGTWVQQAQLFGKGELGRANFGHSVALSLDGNTALIGGPTDNGGTGAAWVFTRAGTSWTEQTKLTATSAEEKAGGGFGISVALSADGNSAVVGSRGRAARTQISTDPYTNTTSYHATEVEPDAYAYGSTLVAGFQVGRFKEAGASNIGWATTTNGASSFTHGFLPGLTQFDSGPWAHVSDPSVAFDARHNVWLINSLTSNSSVIGEEVAVSRSFDGGLTWGNPITVAKAASDKNWVTCDNTSTSPHYGNCYIEWDGGSNGFNMDVSSNGGQTWTASNTPADSAVLGSQPLVQPNGTVVVPINHGTSEVVSFVSKDGGANYSGPFAITGIFNHPDAGPMRSEPIPTAAIAADGKVYVAWPDCRFRGCTGSNTTPPNDIVYSTSSDGEHWTSVKRVPIDATSSGVDHFIPGLAATQSGSGTELGLTYYYFPESNCTTASCQLDVGYVFSPDGGATWTSPVQLAGPSSLSTLPYTEHHGYMVGDYIATSFVARSGVPNAMSVFAVARPVPGATCTVGNVNSCNESIEATNGTLAEPGAGWVFRRSGTSWSQQGAKLTAGEFENGFGTDLALSADGDTVVIGAPKQEGPRGEEGAAWVFARKASTETTWTLQAKLTGAGEVGNARFGSSVAMSGDGGTALVGGPCDGNAPPNNSCNGAVWVFTSAGGTWPQQGPKLTVAHTGTLGSSVALSSAGNTALIGEPNGQTGSAWVYTRSGGVWSQQESVPSVIRESEFEDFGSSVALSGDASTALVGAPGADNEAGAAWVYSNTAPTVAAIRTVAGLEGGGTSVEITGKNFTGTTAVRFGSTNASSFTVTSDTLITAVAPEHSGGTVDVTVTTTSGGTSESRAADAFTYVPPGPPPSVRKLTPKKGPAGGGTVVTVTGANFVGVTGVMFGSSAASVTSVSSTSLTAVSPTGVGRVNVTVTTPNGTSALGSKDRFKYLKRKA